MKLSIEELIDKIGSIGPTEITKDVSAHYELCDEASRRLEKLHKENKKLKKEVERLKEIEWMYNGLCK